MDKLQILQIRLTGIVGIPTIAVALAAACIWINHLTGAN
jgi:hypothetical protein